MGGWRLDTGGSILAGFMPAGERAETLAAPFAPAGLRSLLALAWPIILARATQSVIGFTDALLVAPLGEDALAATTTGGLNSFAFIILPMGTAFIIQSFVAQLRGRGDIAGAQRYAYYGLALALGAALFAGVMSPALPFLIGKLGYSASVERLMVTVMTIRLLAVGPAVATEALGSYFGGLGNTRPAMQAGLVAMVANVGLNLLLIEPHFGLPGYGVRGSAWASVVATWLGFSVVAVRFALARTPGPLGLKARELWRVVRFGLPNGVSWFLEFSAFTLFVNLVVGHLGTTELAAFNVMIQINSMSFMPAFGLASAGAIQVGEAIGAARRELVWPIVRRTGSVAAVWMVSVGLFYLVAPHVLVGFFRPRDPLSSGFGDELVSVGARMLIISAVWQLFDAIGLTLTEALRAAGDTTWCMGARIVLGWAAFIPAGFLLVRYGDGGTTVVMATLGGYILALAAVFAYRFASGAWKRIELIEPAVDG
jgi:multidrug resistance protein, MATE family